MKFNAKDQKGFSLVELMVVVAIIGILAALAVPRFQTFQAKARQSESKTNLSHVYTLQESFRADNDSYSAAAALSVANAVGNGCRVANNLGFQITDCTKVRYVYTNVGAAATFTGTATEFGSRVFPQCATADTWTINQDKRLQDTATALALCM